MCKCEWNTNVCADENTSVFVSVPTSWSFQLSVSTLAPKLSIKYLWDNFIIFFNCTWYCQLLLQSLRHFFYSLSSLHLLKCKCPLVCWFFFQFALLSMGGLWMSFKHPSFICISPFAYYIWLSTQFEQSILCFISMYVYASSEGLGEEIEFLLPCTFDRSSTCNN